MVDLIAFNLLPGAILVVHAALVLLLFALVSKSLPARKFVEFCGKHAIKFSLAVAVAGVFGSLFYSEIAGFEPCVLCWWQRAFTFPLVIIFGLALWKKSRDAFSYAIPLAFLSAIIAAYQSYANLGLGSVLPCTAVGGSCAKVYVLAFGYITIPMMSLTVAVLILLLAWAKKKYDKNSHA